ncbi:S9 family peptidase [Thalassomonas viridans]|uniref:S9 family peptidase n=1 Tax=Thalassomonas viridans TaxID=137584 RepID=A0AAE9Z6E3_9GAMM|nr:S9 family peptidase [Thalassomonas viridans]WDE05927.1 S9 family peptidase [Thalassomonas viridans]
MNLIIKQALCALLLCSFFTFAENLNVKLINELSQRAEIQDAKISPSGRYLALGAIQNDIRGISVLDLKDYRFISAVSLPGNNELGDFFWANDERIVAEVMINHSWQESPTFYGELFAFNYDGSKSKMIYGYRTGKMQTGTAIKQRKATYGWAEIIDPLYDDEDHVLISSTPMDNNGNELANVLKLNIYKGTTKKRLAKSPIAYASFLSKADGTLGLVTGIDEKDKQHTYLYQGKNQWQKLALQETLPNYSPLAFDASGENLYLSSRGQDKSGIYRLNLASGESKAVFTDKKVDISGYRFSVRDRQVYALRLDDGLPEYLLVNKSHDEAKVFKQLLASFPGSEIYITSQTRKGDKFVFLVASDVDPGSLYLYDRKKNQLMFLFSYRKNLDKKLLMPSEPFNFTASDKRTIHGYFTPANSYQADKQKKLVVLVHGGPHGVRDTWSFDPEVQVISQHGFSVLRVNYRGSGGYGADFEVAGYGQWGGKIQQDIAEAVDWAIANKQIDKDKVCIIGHSFGGYSAAMGPINYPGKYACAVASMGVYDLPLMYEEGNSAKLHYGEAYLNKVLGTDVKVQRQMSPAYHAEKVALPLLIFHGEKDERAPIEQAESFTRALDKAEKPYEYHLFDKEGHGFYNPDNQVVYYSKMLTFLQQHLNR